MMLRSAILAAIVLSASAQSALAEIDRSPRPVLRPAPELQPILTPLEISEVLDTALSPAPPRATSLRPVARPKGFAARARAVISSVRYPQSGSVCGVQDIRGQAIAAIPARLQGCGLQSPVKVTEIAGVKLSSPATIDCTTAKALHSWIERGAKPAVGRTGGGLSGLRVVASYSCRTRNNQPGAKISEHGSGRAIDIAGYRMKNGETVSLLKGWNSSAYGQTLRKMHSAACGPFGTVLGPNANRFHLDHFHFDTARYRSGSYCR